MFNTEGLTGKEIIEWIKEHNAEDMFIYFQPQLGYAYKKCKKIDFTVIGWNNKIVEIKG